MLERHVFLILLLAFVLYWVVSCDFSFITGQTDKLRHDNKQQNVDLPEKILRLGHEEAHKAPKVCKSHDKDLSDDKLVIAECYSMYNTTYDELNQTKMQYTELIKEFSALKEKYQSLFSEFTKFKRRSVIPQSDAIFQSDTRHVETQTNKAIRSSSHNTSEDYEADCKRKADYLNLIGDERKHYINGCLQR